MSKIVILGGGFGGVRVALDLGEKLGDRAEITVIDRNGYHLFAPALYEVASAFGVVKDQFSVNLRKTISVPYEDIFGGKRIQFVQAEVQAVSLDQKMLTTKGDSEYPFDYLVLALGSQSADFSILGVKEYAFPFKTIEDAIMLNYQLTLLFEGLGRGKREAPIRLTVAGGGFTGIELSAELAGTMRHLAQKHHLPSGYGTITLVEAGPRILPQVSDGERGRVIKRLTSLGVIVKENSVVREVRDDHVRLENGQILQHHMLAWTAGVRANDFLKTIQGLDLTQNGKVVVDEHLNSVHHKNVFAVGDIVEFLDHAVQRSEPALAYIAIQHGQIVARNIVRSIRGKELVTHKPFYNYWIAPIGGRYALAHLWAGFSVGGILGWIIREVVDFKYFVSILTLRRAWKFLRGEIRVFTRND